MGGLHFLGQLLIHVHIQIQPMLGCLPSILSYGLVMLYNRTSNFGNLQLVTGIDELSFCTPDLLLELHGGSLCHLPKRRSGQLDQREKLVRMIGATIPTTTGEAINWPPRQWVKHLANIRRRVVKLATAYGCHRKQPCHATMIRTSGQH